MLFIVDNGAYTLKAGFASEMKPKILPNYIARSTSSRNVFVADQLGQCRDFAGLRFRLGFEKGIIVDWNVEAFDLFFLSHQKTDVSDTCLVLTEPVVNLPNVQKIYDEVIFEEYQFSSYTRTSASNLALLNDLNVLIGNHSSLKQPDLALLVDTGYSFTHTVPAFCQRVIRPAVKRLDVGGKLLTNYLKEVVSFRQLNMMDETYIMNQVKETCCYVASNVYTELDVFKKSPATIIQNYVLPNYTTIFEGFVNKPGFEGRHLENEQVLQLKNERFQTPEILFNPSDIGINQCGIAEAIMTSINACPKDMHPYLWGNVILLGGNAKFDGFSKRLAEDLRKIVPDDTSIRIFSPPDPTTFAWEGGRNLENSPLFNEVVVSRAEYLESGARICEERFSHWYFNNL